LHSGVEPGTAGRCKPLISEEAVELSTEHYLLLSTTWRRITIIVAISIRVVIWNLTVHLTHPLISLLSSLISVSTWLNLLSNSPNLLSSYSTTPLRYTISLSILSNLSSIDILKKTPKCILGLKSLGLSPHVACRDFWRCFSFLQALQLMILVRVTPFKRVVYRGVLRP